MEVSSYSFANPRILNAKERLKIGRQILAIIEDHYGPQKLRKTEVLDIGCSSGVITSYLADYSSHVTGIDIDEHAIGLAKKEQKKNVDFVAMNCTDMDFPDNSFDIAICNQVYYYLPKAASRRLLSEIYRVLKPGGICFFTGGNRYSLYPKESDVTRYYLSFWELAKLCGQFSIYRYTPKILHDPKKYGFNKLIPYHNLLTLFPVWFFALIEPILPNFIWILEKPAHKPLQSSQE